MRNLSYTSSEEDLEKLFSAYGGCSLRLVLGGICIHQLEAPLWKASTSALWTISLLSQNVERRREWCLPQAVHTVVLILLDTEAPGCQSPFRFRNKILLL